MAGFKKSIYTVAVPVHDGRITREALYQTMTGGFILLPGQIWSRKIAEITRAFDTQGVEMLAAQGFIVPADTDEAAVYNVWKQQYTHDYSALKSTVVLTRQCNLRCTYCILEAENKTMSGKTAAAMDLFYAKQIIEKRPETVRDNFIGGEPLLNPGILMEIVSRRYELCRNRRIDYGFSIITNGTLLDDALVLKMKQSGLTTIRVSLAGPGPVHDSLRVTARGAPTYENILANLQAVSGLTEIMVECQYDACSTDYQMIPDMMDDMIHRGIGITEIAFTPIFARRHDNRFEGGIGDARISAVPECRGGQTGISPVGCPAVQLLHGGFALPVCF